MTLPPLFWPWDYFNTCMGNVPNLDLCIRWTVEWHMWQAAIVAIVIFTAVMIIKERHREEA